MLATPISKYDCLQVPTAFTAAEKQSQLADPDAHQMYAEDFEFSELNFVKSSRMSKRWLLFTCFFKVHTTPCACACGSALFTHQALDAAASGIFLVAARHT